jgi:hypothetical protein
VVEELAKGKHHFKRVAVDSADALYAMCQAHAISELNRQGRHEAHLPGRLRVRQGLGRGRRGVAPDRQALHARHRRDVHVARQEEEIERPVGKVTRYMPSLSGVGAADPQPLRGVRLLHGGAERPRQGDVRVLHSQKSPLHVAGGRFQRPMEDPLIIEAENPLDAGRILYAAMRDATKVQSKEPVAA